MMKIDFNSNMDQQINQNEKIIPIEPSNNIFKRHKKLIFIILAIILLGEFFWAISFIKTSSLKKEKKIETPTQSQIVPKESIASLTIDPQNVETTVGQQFTININVDTLNHSINGVDTVISFDPEILTVIGEVKNGDLFNSLLIKDVKNNVGKINITASKLSPTAQNISGKGTLATVNFKALKFGETQIKIIFDPNRTDTSNIVESKTSKNILTTVSNATIKIGK